MGVMSIVGAGCSRRTTKPKVVSSNVDADRRLETTLHVPVFN